MRRVNSNRFKSRKTMGFISILFFSLVLSSCSNENEEDNSAKHNSVENNDTVQIDGSQVGVEGATSSNQSQNTDDAITLKVKPNTQTPSQSSTQQRPSPPIIEPVVIQTPTYFTPTPMDVQNVFTAALNNTISQAPPSPQKDAWVENELQRLRTLSVHSCTRAPVGVPSTCRISFNGKVVDIKLLYTQSGWQLVR